MKQKTIFILLSLSICAACWSQDTASNELKNKVIFDSLRGDNCDAVEMELEATVEELKEDEYPKEEAIFKYISDQMPYFPGGDEALMKFMADSLRYPKVDAGWSGRVVVRFAIDTVGQIQDVTILRSLSPPFDAEVVRMIRSMPRWIPGEEDGVKVPVYFHLPVRFRPVD